MTFRRPVVPKAASVNARAQVQVQLVPSPVRAQAIHVRLVLLTKRAEKPRWGLVLVLEIAAASLNAAAVRLKGHA